MVFSNEGKTVDTERQLKWVTTASVVVAALLIILKTGAWLLSGSVSMLASLVDSATDFFASLLNLLAVRWAMKPADDGHQFGHGKAESLSALAQAGFIGGSAVFLLLNAIERLMQPQAVEHAWLGVGVMLASMALTLLLVVYQQYVLSRVSSQAVAADRLHYVVDLLGNTVVLVAIILSALGWLWADGLLAGLLGLWVLYQAWKLGCEAVDTLMDKALSPEIQTAIAAAVRAVDGVLGVHDLKTRESANRCFVQIHIELADNLNIVAGHDIAEAAADAVKKVLVGKVVDVLVHQDPIQIEVLTQTSS